MLGEHEALDLQEVFLCAGEEVLVEPVAHQGCSQGEGRVLQCGGRVLELALRVLVPVAVLGLQGLHHSTSVRVDAVTVAAGVVRGVAGWARRADDVTKRIANAACIMCFASIWAHEPARERR